MRLKGRASLVPAISFMHVLIQKPYELRFGRIYLKALDRDLNLERSKAFLDFPARRELGMGNSAAVPLPHPIPGVQN